MNRQSQKPLFLESLSPKQNRRTRSAQLFSNGVIGTSVRSKQTNLGSQNHSLGSGSSPAPSLKCFSLLGLQSKSPPDPANGALTQPTFPGHGAGVPMRRILRGRLQRSGNHALHVGIHNLPGSTGARLIRPSRRWAMNRARHFPTVWGAIWRTVATDRLDFPVAHPSTIRARCASAWVVLRRCIQRSKVSRSSDVKWSGESRRPFLMVILHLLYTLLIIYSTNL